MFGLFGKKEQGPSSPGNTGATAADTLKATIAAQREEDPLIGPKIGAREINHRLMSEMKSDKGVHIESYLVALGALAGFSCQMCVRATPGPINLTVAEGKDGQKYYFGDALNKPLLDDHYSVCSLTAGAVAQFGETAPDIREIFEHVASTVGGEGFGVPRIPAKYHPGDLPLNYLKAFWPRIFPLARQICEPPYEWPILFGIAIQQTMMMAKDVITPADAATIVMECAVPMSKVDLPEFYRAPLKEA
jgi:hypothetical protein